MSDGVLDIITKLVQSPPGQLATGGVLAVIVWKSFERVESILSEDTKLEIAVWLLERKKLSSTFQNWPDTFTKVFDAVFTAKHLSWRCFLRSTAASASLFMVVFQLQLHFSRLSQFDLSENVIVSSLLFGAVVDYLSLVESRMCLSFMRQHDGVLALITMVVLDLLFTLLFSSIAGTAWASFQTINREFYMLGLPRSEFFGGWLSSIFVEFICRFRFYPIFTLTGLRPSYMVAGEGVAYNFALPYYASALFTSIWLWLYAGSGFLLKSTCGLDIGFEWFNRKFDIEKKPLQCIGLISGSLVAVVYWVVVIVARLV